MVKDMVEIYKCKYLLPCGYCDKYDIPCKADREKVVSYPEELYKELKGTTEKLDEHYKNTSTSGCNHNWYYDSYESWLGLTRRKYVCNKCGEVKYEIDNN